MWHATNGHSWHTATGWKDYLVHPDYCGSKSSSAWFGVVCSSGNVVLLTLPSNNLDGTLPPELAQLSALVNLDLRGNKLSGELPSELFTLSQLQTLLLYQNSLSGTLPSNFAGVSSLVTVNLDDNAFTGPLPTISCPSLCLLKQLELANNRLEDPLPDMFGALPFLETIDLSANSFSGPIPPSLPQISQLTSINLSNNSLSGTLSPYFARASLLSILKVSNNKLEGTIPRLPQLQESSTFVFDGSDNAFNGSVPEWAGCYPHVSCALGGNPDLHCQTSCPGNQCHVTSCSSCYLPSCVSDDECKAASGPCTSCDPKTHKCVVPPPSPPPPPSSPSGTTSPPTTTATTATSGPHPPSPPPPLFPTSSGFTTLTSSTGYSSTGNATRSTGPHHGAYGVIVGIVVTIVVCVAVVVAVAIIRVRRAAARDRAEAEALLSRSRYGRASLDFSGVNSGRGMINSSGGSFYYGGERSGDDSSGGRISAGSEGSFRTAKDRTKELSVRFDTASSGKRGEVFTFVIDTRLEIIKWDELEITGEIGRGGYGTVLRARRGHTDVAVKVLRNIVHPEQVQAFVEEASILSDLKHPNCVLLMGVCVEPHHMSIVTEYMRGGDLHALIYPYDNSLLSASATSSLLTRRRRFQILYEIALGLEYLHARGIAHRDIKLRNILLDEKTPQTAKLADFGLAGLKKMDIGGGGTEMYSAPEVLGGSTADKRSDMFSFAIVMFEVLYSHKPTTVTPAGSETLNGNNVSIPEDCPLELATLIRACLSPNPSARPPIARITGLLEELADQNVFSVGPLDISNPPAPHFEALPTDSPSRHRLPLPSPSHQSAGGGGFSPSMSLPSLPPASGSPKPPDFGY